MLGNPKLRKVASLGTAAVGAFTLLAPKKAAVLGDKLALSPKYEHVGDADLVPKDWYVDATRASGAGMLAAGLTGFLLATRDDETAERATSDDADTASGVDEIDVVETERDVADDPVEIDLDDLDDADEFADDD